MTDREKIIETLRASGYGYFITHEVTNADEALADTADALIAAGIGDVSELKNHRLVAEYSLIPEDGNAYVLPNTPIRVKQLYSGEEVEKIVKERDEYKHRSEVAERALKNALNNDTCYFCNEKIPCRCEHRDWGSDECIKSLLRQAEKELQEEKR